MKLSKFNLLSLFLSLFALLGCRNNAGTNIASETINSNQGISIETLDLINDGPQNFILDYFPKATIYAAKVKECEIIQRDSTASRVARKVQFDQNGNIIRDENKFFFYWFKGTVTGTFNYLYNGERKLKMIGIPQEDSKDSIMTVWNYNTQGLLYSRDSYQFAKRLKRNADRHLPDPSDYEKYPSWNKQKTYLYSVASDSVNIELIVESKITNTEKYQLLFDSMKRLKAVNEFRYGNLQETTDYLYEPNSITGFSRRINNDTSKWKYKTKSILNKKERQIERILLNEDGTEKIKMIVAYNENGTIKTIKYGNTIQEFRYLYTAE